MAYIKRFMYKCTTRLLSLIVTFNTIGVPCNCEAVVMPAPPPVSFNNFSTLISAAATAAAAAATATYKLYHGRSAENVAGTNPAVQDNPSSSKEVNASGDGLESSSSTIEGTKPLTTVGNDTITEIVSAQNDTRSEIASVGNDTITEIVSTQNDTRPEIASVENDTRPETVRGGNNTSSDNISVGGDGSEGSTPEPESISSVTSSPGGTQHFLKEILNFHNYTTSQVHQSLKNRLSLQAVAAGDESQKIEKGLWTQGIVGNAVERKSSSSSGYNGRFHGFTVGADAEFNNDLLLGVAFSSIISSLKFKDQYNGDKTSINTKAASLYGKKDISNTVYVSTTASLTKSSTNASYLVTNAQGQQSYKYQEQKNINGGFVEARLHYVNTFSNNMVLTPFLGIGYSKSALPGFSGIDSTGLSFAIASLKSEYSNVMLGTYLSLPSYVNSKLAIMPKINASIDQRIYSKVGSVQITDSNGNPVTIKSSDKNKTTLNLGGSMDVAYKCTDFLLAYDTQIRNKFLGQQIALKVKVNL